MKQIRSWLAARSRLVSAGLVAGSFLACGDPVSIRGDKSLLVVLAGVAAVAVVLRVVRPLVAVLAA